MYTTGGQRCAAVNRCVACDKSNVEEEKGTDGRSLTSRLLYSEGGIITTPLSEVRNEAYVLRLSFVCGAKKPYQVSDFVLCVFPLSLASTFDPTFVKMASTIAVLFKWLGD